MRWWIFGLSLPALLGCSGGTKVRVSIEDCGDGLDNDANGLVDCDDAACPCDSGDSGLDTATDTADTSEDLGDSGDDTDDTSEPWDPNKPLELCINEFMPDNEASVSDDLGVYADWIELHNPGDEAVSLDGWSLTDDRDDPTLHVMSGGLSVGAHEFLLLWADGDASLGSAHLGFKLSGDGEEVGLYAPDGRGSLVQYGAVTSDISLARVPDCCTGSAECWSYVYRGTPGATNYVPEPETVSLLPTGADWSYLDDGTGPSGDWTGASYDDSAWASGPAPLGYGDSHIVTTVDYGGSDTAKHITTWFRASFSASDVAKYTSLTLSLMRDDGAVVYLNGTEIARSNLEDGTITSSTLAEASVSGSDETAFYTFDVDVSLLAEGKNVLAAELHQASAGSSDLGFDLGLEGEYTPSE